MSDMKLKDLSPEQRPSAVLEGSWNPRQRTSWMAFLRLPLEAMSCFSAEF